MAQAPGPAGHCASAGRRLRLRRVSVRATLPTCLIVGIRKVEARPPRLYQRIERSYHRAIDLNRGSFLGSTASKFVCGDPIGERSC
jgi:hypothetical protein